MLVLILEHEVNAGIFLFRAEPKRSIVKRFEDTTYVFIIRIWQEPHEGEQSRAEWRGTIERIGANQRFYFHELKRILEIIRESTGLETDEIPD